MIYCDVVRGTAGKIGHFSGVSVLKTVYNHTSDEEVMYLDENGSTQFCSSYELFTGQRTWGAQGETHWYVAESTYNRPTPSTWSVNDVNPYMNVYGDVHLIIKDGVKIANGASGIKIHSGSSLTIYAQSTGSNMGELYMNGTTGEGEYFGNREGLPGIDASGATLTINGGRVIGQARKTRIGIECSEGGSLIVNGGGVNSNITINGGHVSAQNNDNDNWGYAIGCSPNWGYSNININGGIVKAYGGYYAAGIGSGYWAGCGDITIAKTVTQVTATKGEYAPHSIGIGEEGSCGTVTIGGIVGVIEGSPYTYQPPEEPVEPEEPDVNSVDLGSLTGDYEVQDGDVLTGTLGGNYKITIADGATVTLRNAAITCLNGSAKYAGITLSGDATIILEDNNTVKGGYAMYPGVAVPEGKNLTIEGNGSLDASSNGYGCGIGSGYGMSAGNIVINGGTIKAAGGSHSAGIGSGGNGNCGNILITSNVTQVTATKGDDANYSIGSNGSGTCGTVTIGGIEGAIEESPYTYQP